MRYYFIDYLLTSFEIKTTLLTFGNTSNFLVVPGTEELSGDDDDIPSTPPRNIAKKTEKPKIALKTKSVKRPRILKRRTSRNFQMSGKDWGERCVDMFEVIAQIGEG